MNAIPRMAARSGMGFSLVELVVTLAVAGIVLAVAVPAFSDMLLGSRLTAHANALVASSNLSRSEAIKRNTVITLCASSDGTSCSDAAWDSGWIVLAGETLLYAQGAARSGIRISNTVKRIDYQPTGVGATVSEFIICRDQPSSGPQERVLRINAVGRASVESRSSSGCEN